MSASNFRQERAAAVPKPIFPPWLVRHDPVLARVEDNGIYMAFRARRREHRGRGVRKIVRALSRLDVWLSIAISLVIIAVAIFYTQWLCPAMLLLVLFGFFQRGRSEAHFEMPLRASALISSEGACNTNALRDLWHCPGGGRELAEAIYLESREQTVFWAWALAVFVAAVSVIVQAAAGNLLSPAMLLFLPALFLLCCALFRLVVVEGAHYSREAHLQQRIHAVRRIVGIETLPRRAARVLGEFLQAGAVLIVILLVLGLIICVGGFANDFLERLSSESLIYRVWDTDPISYGFAYFFAALAFCLWLLNRQREETLAARQEETLARAAWYLEMLYGSVVEQDLDVYVWAVWLRMRPEGERTWPPGFRFAVGDIK